MIRKLLFIFVLCFLYSKTLLSNNYTLSLIGNEYIDKQILLSLIKDLPENINDLQESKIISELNKTGYFKNIEVNKSDNVVTIKLDEYPIIKEVNFKKIKDLKKMHC